MFSYKFQLMADSKAESGNTQEFKNMNISYNVNKSAMPDSAPTGMIGLTANGDTDSLVLMYNAIKDGKYFVFSVKDEPNGEYVELARGNMTSSNLSYSGQVTGDTNSIYNSLNINFS